LNQNKQDRESVESASFSIFNSTFSILRQMEQALFLLDNGECEMKMENGLTFFQDATSSHGYYRAGRKI